MSALDHPEYHKEIDRLNYTINYLKGCNKNSKIEKQRIDKAVDYSITHYNSDNAEQFNELMINTKIQDSLSQKLKDINKSLSKPYFARVDFTEEGNNKLQNFYIGKMALLRDEDQELIITDWRAPIATLYYEGRIGDAAFYSPEGEVNGQITLKRQYVIETGQLNEIYDIDITTNDEFLQAALGSSKDRRLKDIVSTIQAEQNKVIRADMWKPLVVQGAAGGGKTTIALHRIAYLLYNYGGSLNSNNFMIIAPNRFFLSYISEVLPDLGVENVLQTTFEDFAVDITSEKLKIKNAYDKLSYLLNQEEIKTQKDQIQNISYFKSSLNFKDLLNDYVKIIEEKFVPAMDFKVDSFILIKHEDIKKSFLYEYGDIPYAKRINEIKKTLRNTLKFNKKSIVEKIEREFDSKIDEARETMEDSTERRQIIIELTEARDAAIEKTKNKFKTVIKNYISGFKVLSPLEYYKNLLNNKEIFHRLSKPYLSKDMAEEVRLETLNNLNNNQVEIEDLSPIMYIKHKVIGLEEKLTVRHVVIDEAQDFSPFQLYIIKEIIGGNSFTILGDLCQGIYSYRGINDWESVSESIFGSNNYTMLTLEQSYRTTIEIMEAANEVIKSLHNSSFPPSKPVIRHGEKVTVTEKSNLKDIAKEITEIIKGIKQEGFKSAAIVCKTLEESKEIKAYLKGLGYDINTISGSEDEYFGGVVIIPSYLVKGLEFDVVIIANGSSSAYSEDPLDVKLLYIAMTRPLHRLYIYSVGERAKMLNNII